MASSSNKDFTGLVEANHKWSAEFNKEHPGFLQKLADDPQRPKFLWIGCSDSRIPENTITAKLPGVIFVQRNIANQLPPNDDNANAVLAYAVGHLEVTHVVVVGHIGCGGIKAAYDEVHNKARSKRGLSPGDEFIHRWIQPIVKLVPSKPVPPEKLKEELIRLSKENVRVQVANIKKSSIIGNNVSVHGLIYDLETGLLQEVL